MSSVFVLVWFDVGIGTKSNPASDFLDMQIASEWARARARFGSLNMPPQHYLSTDMVDEKTG